MTSQGKEKSLLAFAQSFPVLLVTWPSDLSHHLFCSLVLGTVCFMWASRVQAAVGAG